jgi:hypothetical protein
VKNPVDPLEMTYQCDEERKARTYSTGDKQECRDRTRELDHGFERMEKYTDYFKKIHDAL